MRPHLPLLLLSTLHAATSPFSCSTALADDSSTLTQTRVYTNGTWNERIENINITLENYELINISNNSGAFSGGAIFLSDASYKVTISNSWKIVFDKNSVSSGQERVGGGALYNYGTMCFDSNGRITFSGNSSSVIGNGGAIYNNGMLTFSDNGDISFSDNSVYSGGGAIYNNGMLTFSGNGDISFSNNSSPSSGGAIFNHYEGTLTFSGNGDISFTGNTGNHVGTIDNGGTLTFSGNRDISFTGNTGNHVGTIYNCGTLTFSDNRDISFSGNKASSRGAIVNEQNSVLTFSANRDITFSGNSAVYDGGAIDNERRGTLTFSSNRDISFSGNKALNGGAICNGGTLTFSGNGDISFTGNSATDSVSGYSSYGGAIYNHYCTLTFSGNGNISFSNNNNSSSSGGAIYNSSSTLTFSGNGDISFSGNTALNGGAIHNSTSTLTFSGNGNISFTGNSATGSSPYSSPYGGAIYNASSTLTFSGNGDITFRGNYEKADNRLRSLYCAGGTITLSATTGKSITFYDSIYTSGSTTLELNKKYKDTEGNTVSATGAIVFTGETTREDLTAAFAANGVETSGSPTEEQLLASRSSKIGKAAKLYAGSLVVREQAVLNAAELVVMTSADTVGGTRVVLSNGTLNSEVSFETDTFLQLTGANSAAGTLTFADGAGLVFDLTSAATDTPLLVLTGSLVQNGGLVISISDTRSDHALLSCTEEFDQSYWNADYVKVIGSSFNDLYWQGNTLYCLPPLKAAVDDIVLNGQDKVLEYRTVYKPARIVVDGAGNPTISGVGCIAGSGSLDKNGKGELVIDTENPDWQGHITVNDGTLTAGKDSSLGTGYITMNDGKLVAPPSGLSLVPGQKLTLNGGDISGNVTVGDGATLVSLKTAAIDGNMTLGGGVWEIDTVSGPLLDISGSLIIAGDTQIKLSAISLGDLVLAQYKALQGDVEKLHGDGLLRSERVSYNIENTGASLVLHVKGVPLGLTWQGAKGVWQHGGSYLWQLPEGVEADARFFDLDGVSFNTKATVTITGDVAPYSMTVAVMGKDALTFSGKGAIVGEGSLTMEGTGTLKLNATNAYSGGSIVNSGTVTATGDKSFGSGAITLNGGTLNLGGKVIANDITASAGTLSGAAKYAGSLTVDGAVTLNGNLLAKSVTVDGTLKAGTIKDTAIVLNDGSISSAISGKSSVTLTGGGTLTGKLSYTGGTTLAGGSIAADFTVAAKQTLAATSGSVEGALTLSGGSVLLATDSSLSVGTLKLTKASTLDVSALNGTATISFDSLTGDTAKFLKLSAPAEGRKSYAIEIGGNAITVTASGDNTGLTWQGAKGKWEVAGTQVWDGSTADNRFYHGDKVTFSSAATVTLATKLAPGNVTVTGSGAVTFSGSGSIAGDAALTMIGTNTLKLNATNTYTGGTVITSGTVLATGVDSFGKGDITLSGGTLNLGKKAIKNSILVDGTATILNGKGFAGIITVQGGTLSLTDSLTGTLVLNGGTLDLSGVKNIAKMIFGTVICEKETDIVDAKGNHYAFVDGKLVPTDRTIAATPVPQHVELPGAGLYTTMMRAQLDGNRAAFDSIRQLMGTGEPSSADGRYRFAAQATSASTDMKDYRRNGFGGLVMVEEVFSDKAVGGISLNYEHADINPDGAGKYESDDTRVNAHLLVSSKNWHSRSIAGIGIHDYDVNHSSATGHSFNLMEEISRTIAVDDKSVIAPFVRVETGYNVIGSINDGLLAIDKQTAWFTDVTLGARYVKTCDFGSVMLEAGVTKAIGDQGGAIGASLVDDPAIRAALSPSSRNRWSATLGGSVQVPVGTRSSLNAGATLRLHGGTTEVNANVGYSIKF